jgi:hypothetical protein
MIRAKEGPRSKIVTGLVLMGPVAGALVVGTRFASTSLALSALFGSHIKGFGATVDLVF